MPTCNHSGKNKSEDEFNWRYKALGIRHPTCRECQKPFRKNWYEENKVTHLANVYERKERIRREAREFVWEYKSTHPCSNCGESDPDVLEFHHKGGKDKDVSRMVADGLSIDRIRREIQKTEMLCSNCHRKRTSKDQGWFRRG